MSMRSFKAAFALAGSLLFAADAHAGAAAFSTTNVQYLYGGTYADFGSESDEASIVTLEHFNAWKYGDNFFFVDITNPDREGDLFGTSEKGTGAFYAELSPRLSVGKILGKKLEWGPIVDLLLTGTLEIPESPVEQTYLYGLAADLKLPGFAFFQFNWYVRNNQTVNVDTGQQVTLVWLVPFAWGKASFAFEGFFDYAWGEDPLQDNIITAPRLLVDVGNFFGKPGMFQVGCEYQIWRNKFGIDDLDEDVAQAMVKWIW